MFNYLIDIFKFYIWVPTGTLMVEEGSSKTEMDWDNKPRTRVHFAGCYKCDWRVYVNSKNLPISSGKEAMAIADAHDAEHHLNKKGKVIAVSYFGHGYVRD
jgi:monoamine oxidase